MLQRQLHLPVHAPKERIVGFSAVERRARNATRIIYNRVRKCASTTVITILDHLMDENNAYTMVHSLQSKYPHPPQNQIHELLRALNETCQPWIFHRHLHFVDFQAHRMPFTPVYVNVIRRPVDRFISDYYFKRFRWSRNLTNEERHMTFDECVLGNHSECLEEQAFRIIPYFCGQRDLCLTPSRQALELAKHNVIKHYSVVGLQEDLLHTFALWEQTSPNIFANLTLFAYRFLRHPQKINVSKDKKPVSDEAKRRMSERLGYENEFYDFIQDRLLAMQVYFKTEMFLKKTLHQAALDQDSDDFATKMVELQRSRHLTKVRLHEALSELDERPPQEKTQDIHNCRPHRVYTNASVVWIDNFT